MQIDIYLATLPGERSGANRYLCIKIAYYEIPPNGKVGYTISTTVKYMQGNLLTCQTCLLSTNWYEKYSPDRRLVN